MSGKSTDYQAKADQANKNAQAALQQKSYSDPFGSFKNGVYTPTMSDTQKNSLNAAQQGLAGYTSALQKPFNINDYYNNPFYQNTYNQLSAPINRQYQQDYANLQDNLNAKGQLGSSYAARQNNQLLQNRDNSLNQVNVQALGASADAYNQTYNNNLAGLTGMNQNLLSQQGYLYQPLQMALAYQQAVNPLQIGASNAYASQAQNLLQAQQTAQQMAKQQAQNQNQAMQLGQSAMQSYLASGG
jgi:hypothetical protein